MIDETLQPLPNFALVELEQKYQSGLVSDREKYSTNSSGVLRKVSILSTPAHSHIQLEDYSEYYHSFINQTVYFTPFEDGDIIKHEDKEYVFIPISALRGGKK